MVVWIGDERGGYVSYEGWDLTEANCGFEYRCRVVTQTNETKWVSKYPVLSSKPSHLHFIAPLASPPRAPACLHPSP